MATKSTLIIDGQNRGALNAINQTTSSLGRAVGDVQKLGGGLTGALSGFTGLLTNIPFLIGAAATAAVAGFGAMIKSSIDMADSLNEMSQRTGASVEFLSKMAFVAELSGTSIENLEVGFKKLSRAMNDASNGLATAKRPFDQLGISVNDAEGNLRDVEEVVFDVADKFSQMKDGAQKTAMSMEIFGRSGAGLIPILNEGSEGLQKQFELAKQLGVEISTKTAKQADEFKDNLTLLEYSMKGAANAVAEELLPELTSLSGNLVDVATNTNTVSVLAEGLVTILKVLATVFIGLGSAVYEAGQSLGVLGATMAKIVTLDFEGAAFVWKKGWEDVGEFAGATFDIMDALWSKGKDYKETLAEINAAKEMEEHQLTIQKLAEEWEKVNDQINRDLVKENYGEIAAQVNVIDEKFEEWMSKFPGYTEMITEWRDAMVKGIIDASLPEMPNPEELPFDMLDTLPDDRARYSEWSDFRIAEEARVTNQFLIEQAIRQGALSDTLANMADAFSSTYTLITNESGKKHKALFDISKAFAIGEAIVNTYLGATKALAEIPPPFSFAVAASIVAAGLANVARIASAQPGVASGGGTSGTPAAPVSPQNNNTDNRQISYVINFYGSNFNDDPDKFARDIIGSLNKAQGDGFTINAG